MWWWMHKESLPQSPRATQSLTVELTPRKSLQYWLCTCSSGSDYSVPYISVSYVQISLTIESNSLKYSLCEK